MAQKKKAGARDRKNTKFHQKHQDLPLNLHKQASRTAWAEAKRLLRAIKKSVLNK